MISTDKQVTCLDLNREEIGLREEPTEKYSCKFFSLNFSLTLYEDL